MIAASGGNFGLAVAYAASRLGHRAEVFVPESTPEVKIDGLRAYGAEVNIHGGFYAEALEAAERRRADSGALWTHAFDQPEMVAGNGTVGLELGEQVRGLDTLLVAVGGAGLIGGIAAWFRGNPRVVGVETEGTASLAAAMAHGAPVDIEIGGIAADSLGARRVGDIGFAIARRFVDRVAVVDDEAVKRAQRALWDRLRIIVEPGGAAVSPHYPRARIVRMKAKGSACSCAARTRIQEASWASAHRLGGNRGTRRRGGLDLVGGA